MCTITIRTAQGNTCFWPAPVVFLSSYLELYISPREYGMNNPQQRPPTGSMTLLTVSQTGRISPCGWAESMRWSFLGRLSFIFPVVQYDTIPWTPGTLKGLQCSH